MEKGQTLTVEMLKDGRQINCEEALQLLRMYGPKFWSWGASKFTNVQDYALRFKVQGHHHKGLVYMTVTYDDMYRIILTDTSNVIKEVLPDMFFDDVFDAMDEKIEKISAYKN